MSTPWHFARGTYLSTVSISRNSVSSGPAVNKLREALGFGVGMFDQYLRNAVIDRQRELGLPVTGVVTEVDWDAIVNAGPAAEESEAPKAPVKSRKPRGPRKPRKSAPPAPGSVD